ncbi:hypothetical protein N8865_03165 [Francisellaceae bacterium]|nr:hypothetical protein [Francisellaceae bacterium]
MLKGICIIFIFLMFISINIQANSESLKIQCENSHGDFIQGKITSKPYFRTGKHYKKGYEISHTIFDIRDKKTKENYRIVLDNLFAKNYDNRQSIPKGYESQLKKGGFIKVCGLVYKKGKTKGIHWTHLTCGKNNKKPNGFIITETSLGKSISASQHFCKLWN